MTCRASAAAPSGRFLLLPSDRGARMLLSLRKLYTDFPWVFDALYPVIYDYAKDFACYDRLLNTAGAHRILDLGCGTGLLARHLVRAGYDYTGMDISAGMLAVARRNVPYARFIQCDMRDLAPLRAEGAGKFDAIICTGRAFAHLLFDAEVRGCLRVVAALLRSGGIFACDIIDAREVYPKQVHHVTESTRVGTRVFRREFTHTRLPGEGTALDTTIHWRISEGDEVIAEFDDEARTRAFNPNELRDFLASAGLFENMACTHLPHQPVILIASACKVEV